MEVQGPALPSLTSQEHRSEVAARCLNSSREGKDLTPETATKRGLLT